MHKDRRSTSRSNSAKRNLDREIDNHQNWIDENRANIAAYNNGVQAINRAAATDDDNNSDDGVQ